MNTATEPSKAKLWTGRVLSAIPALMMLPGIFMNFTRNPQAIEGMKKFGYQEDALFLVGTLAVIAVVLYVIPQTAVLGAIVMTGYFGGAIATHLRINDPGWPMALAMGILTWLGLYLREPRLRALVPLRKLD